MPKNNEDVVRTTIRVPKALWRRIEHACSELDMFIQDYVTKILDENVPTFVVREKGDQDA